MALDLRTREDASGDAVGGVAERPRRTVPLATAVLLGATALLPQAARWVDRTAVVAAVALAAVALVAGLLLGLRALHRARATGATPARHAARTTMTLVLHLWPVGLLTIIYPVASRRMTGVEVGGAELTALLLAVSLTVPWLSQGVCMPLYRAIGPLLSQGDTVAVRERFCEVWPMTFVQTLPVIALFAVPVQLATGWSLETMGAYVLLCVLDLAFAQSLVLTNIGRERAGWALAWTGYSAALLFFPTVYLLPPVLGLLPQLFVVARHLPSVRFASLDRREALADVVRGLLLGSVLWADKLFYFLRDGSNFAVSTVFLALLPAVLAYNYYFVRLAPGFDAGVAALRHAMENEPIRVMDRRSKALFRTVRDSILGTAFAGAVLVFATSWVLVDWAPGRAGLVAAVAVASWLFMMTTVVCYKLDYIGHTGAAQTFSALHLVLCAVALFTLPTGAVTYTVLAAAELVLFAVVLRVCLSAWRAPEYTFFWRHALAW